MPCETAVTIGTLVSSAHFGPMFLVKGVCTHRIPGRDAMSVSIRVARSRDFPDRTSSASQTTVTLVVGGPFGANFCSRS